MASHSLSKLAVLIGGGVIGPEGIEINPFAGGGIGERHGAVLPSDEPVGQAFEALPATSRIRDRPE
jgi:hypothetical protein